MEEEVLAGRPGDAWQPTPAARQKYDLLAHSHWSLALYDERTRRTDMIGVADPTKTYLDYTVRLLSC